LEWIVSDGKPCRTIHGTTGAWIQNQEFRERCLLRHRFRKIDDRDFGLAIRIKIDRDRLGNENGAQHGTGQTPKHFAVDTRKRRDAQVWRIAVRRRNHIENSVLIHVSVRGS
jgi:hypothetical protein